MVESEKKERRNINIDRDLDSWLRSDVDNVSELINTLLLAYRAYGGDEIEAARYTAKKQLVDTVREVG